MPFELKFFYTAIAKRFLNLILIPLISVIISGIISFFVIEPEYESNITFYLAYKPNSYTISDAYGNTLISRQLIKDYTEIIKSKKNMEHVISVLGLEGYTPEGLGKKINIKFRDDTNIIEVRVRSNSPKIAKKTAEAVGQILVKRLKEFSETFNIEIIDNAETPETPVNPRHVFNIAVVFLASLVVSISIALLLEYMDNTIKSREDVEKSLDLVVLGSIPMVD